MTTLCFIIHLFSQRCEQVEWIQLTHVINNKQGMLSQHQEMCKMDCRSFTVREMDPTVYSHTDKNS